MLSGKKIVVGVSGSIAAYKVPETIRRLREQGAEVRVVMTKNAERLISALIFEAVSGNPVLRDEFSPNPYGAMGHITITEGLDCMVIAPATANIIGKIAAGIADDALSTAVLAASCPLLVAPAMNERMFRNRMVQRNIGILRDAGVLFVDPEEGDLACGATGQGRLAGTCRILDAVSSVLNHPRSLAGEKVLVTAGPTREPIDAVRFLSNPSSGRMGYALASAARDRGADVVLVSGPTNLPRPAGIKVVTVTTAAEMRDAVLNHATMSSIIIMAAAVSDFRALSPTKEKLKKEHAALSISLERTADILAELGKDKKDRILVGFAAEHADLLDNARKKLEQKNLDLIVANDISRSDCGFGAEMNHAFLLNRDGDVMELPMMSKREMAEKIMEKLAELKAKQGL
jgi:phosphopantothenoylcysteine decarboxylase/phosphopantothenate--cysteine ligase